MECACSWSARVSWNAQSVEIVVEDPVNSNRVTSHHRVFETGMVSDYTKSGKYVQDVYYMLFVHPIKANSSNKLHRLFRS